MALHEPRHFRWAVLVLGVVLTAGCSSLPPLVPSQLAQPATQAVGTVQILGDGATVQVKASQMVISTEKLTSPPTYLAVQSRVCLAGPGSISRQPWTARDSAGDTYHPEYIPIGVPDSMSLYPNDPSTPYVKGDCIQGWLFFRVPASTSKLIVRYLLANTSLEIRQWQT